MFKHLFDFFVYGIYGFILSALFTPFSFWWIIGFVIGLVIAVLIPAPHEIFNKKENK